MKIRWHPELPGCYGVESRLPAAGRLARRGALVPAEAEAMALRPSTGPVLLHGSECAGFMLMGLASHLTISSGSFWMMMLDRLPIAAVYGVGAILAILAGLGFRRTLDFILCIHAIARPCQVDTDDYGITLRTPGKERTLPWTGIVGCEQVGIHGTVAIRLPGRKSIAINGGAYRRCAIDELFWLIIRRSGLEPCPTRRLLVPRLAVMYGTLSGFQVFTRPGYRRKYIDLIDPVLLPASPSDLPQLQEQR